MFDTAAKVNSNSNLFFGGAFDGRYVYLFPLTTGQITQYDTTLSFTSSGSYAVNNTTITVNSLSTGFGGAVFDGRYIYIVPSTNPLIVRFDTTLPFSKTSSYAIFVSSQVSASFYGFQGGIFDGRYVYFVPNFTSTASGIVGRYDVTLPFGATTSYATFDLTTVASSLTGFIGAVFDGKYVYLVPNNNGSDFGQLVRMDAYSGPIATAQTIGYASGAFTVTGNLSFNVATSGSAAVGSTTTPSNPAGFLIVQINGSPYKVPYFN